MQNRAVSNPKLSFMFNSEVTLLHGDSVLTGITVRDTVTGALRDLSVTGLFIAIGLDPRTELFTGQLDLDDAAYITVAGRSSRTNIPGVFACGDVVDHAYRQAITAADSGCAAALDTEQYLASLTDDTAPLESRAPTVAV